MDDKHVEAGGRSTRSRSASRRCRSCSLIPAVAYCAGGLCEGAAAVGARLLAVLRHGVGRAVLVQCEQGDPLRLPRVPVPRDHPRRRGLPDWRAGRRLRRPRARALLCGGGRRAGGRGVRVTVARRCITLSPPTVRLRAVGDAQGARARRSARATHASCSAGSPNYQDGLAQPTPPPSPRLLLPRTDAPVGGVELQSDGTRPPLLATPQPTLLVLARTAEAEKLPASPDLRAAGWTTDSLTHTKVTSSLGSTSSRCLNRRSSRAKRTDTSDWRGSLARQFRFASDAADRRGGAAERGLRLAGRGARRRRCGSPSCCPDPSGDRKRLEDNVVARGDRRGRILRDDRRAVWAGQAPHRVTVTLKYVGPTCGRAGQIDGGERPLTLLPEIPAERIPAAGRRLHSSAFHAEPAYANICRSAGGLGVCKLHSQ